MSKLAANMLEAARTDGWKVYGEVLAAALGTDGSHYYHSCWTHAACHIVSPPLRNDPSTPDALMEKLKRGELNGRGPDVASPHQLETSPERNRDDSFGKCRTFSASSSPHQYHKRFVSSTPILQLWHVFLLPVE
uniref:Uncharacterized protein n=1 Tax=Timema bartmani TaxID=61472 RepID=A0A7R9F736_9NEOP|nr:unnamed protein product [Timema bartmani]